MVKAIKRALAAILVIVGILLLTVLGYVSYLFIDYSRYGITSEDMIKYPRREVICVVLPSFKDFINSVDMDKFSYDLAASASPDLKNASKLFSQEQYEFVTKTFATMSLALLQQYHTWLSEQLSE